MAVYHHALVLINSSQDGVPLLEHAARMAEENGMRITIAHISTDYRALNYVSDSLRDDRVSQEVIQAKALLNELACTVSLPVDTVFAPNFVERFNEPVCETSIIPRLVLPPIIFQSFQKFFPIHPDTNFYNRLYYGISDSILEVA